jgi:hypothetical protein
MAKQAPKGTPLDVSTKKGYGKGKVGSAFGGK